MPSPDLLPQGRSFPSVPPPQLEQVIRGARRRRARQLSVLGASVAAVVTAAAIVFTPHGSSASLHVVTPALPDHSTSPAPGAPPVVVVPNSKATAPADGGHGVAVQRPGTPTGKQSVLASTTRVRGHVASTPQAPAPAPMVGPTHRTTKYNATHPCNGSGPTAANGWCSYYDGATAGVAGHVVTLATAVCRLPGQGAGVLTSKDGQQADFAVGKDSYLPVWTWSHGHKFAKSATSIRVPAGMCVEWFVSWSVVNDAGGPLEPGTYYLAAAPAMTGGGRASATADNPTTFTVR